jgi:uncharacterized phage infection (PIP) family protein YhgE
LPSLLFLKPQELLLSLSFLLSLKEKVPTLELLIQALPGPSEHIPGLSARFSTMSSGARKAIALLTKKVTKKATSKKKSKNVGTSKRRRKDDTSKEEEKLDNPNDSDFDPADEAAVPYSWCTKMR